MHILLYKWSVHGKWPTITADLITLQNPSKLIDLVMQIELTQLNSRFFRTLLPRAGAKRPPAKDELFDAFAVDNFIEKYCQCKQELLFCIIQLKTIPNT